MGQRHGVCRLRLLRLFYARLLTLAAPTPGAPAAPEPAAPPLCLPLLLPALLPLLLAQSSRAGGSLHCKCSGGDVSAAFAAPCSSRRCRGGVPKRGLLLRAGRARSTPSTPLTPAACARPAAHAPLPGATQAVAAGGARRRGSSSSSGAALGSGRGAVTLPTLSTLSTPSTPGRHRGGRPTGQPVAPGRAAAPHFHTFRTFHTSAAHQPGGLLPGSSQGVTST